MARERTDKELDRKPLATTTTQPILTPMFQPDQIEGVIRFEPNNCTSQSFRNALRFKLLSNESGRNGASL